MSQIKKHNQCFISFKNFLKSNSYFEEQDNGIIYLPVLSNGLQTDGSKFGKFSLMIEDKKFNSLFFNLTLFILKQNNFDESLLSKNND